MPRASLVAKIGSILAALTLSQPALAASAVQAQPETHAAAPPPELIAANPDGTAQVIVVINYEDVAGRRLQTRLEALSRDNPDLKIVVRPISGIGPRAEFLAKAAYAAARQGRFAAYHAAAVAAPIANTWYSLRDSAPLLGLDWQRFQQDFMDPKIADDVRANVAFAEGLGIASTPAFVAGGRVFAGAWDAINLSQVASAARSSGGVMPAGAK